MKNKKLSYILLSLFAFSIWMSPLDLYLPQQAYHFRDILRATLIVKDLGKYANLKSKKVLIEIADARGEKYAQRELLLKDKYKLKTKKDEDIIIDSKQYYSIIFDLTSLDLPLGKYYLTAKLGDTFGAKKKFKIVSSQPKHRYPQKTKSVIADLSIEIDTDKDAYSYNEKIKVALKVTNANQKVAKRILFTSGQSYDFIIIQKSTGREKWRWSNNRAFTLALRPGLILAGESKIYLESIKLSAFNLPLGKYLLIGEFQGVPDRPQVAKEILITGRPVSD